MLPHELYLTARAKHCQKRVTKAAVTDRNKVYRVKGAQVDFG